MRKTIGILFLLFAFISISSAQVNFIAEDGNVNPGDTLTINVKVTNYNGVGSFEYRQSFDTSIFDFVDAVDIHADIVGLAYTGPKDRATPTDFIQYTWLEQTGGSVTLPDSSLLYALRFVAKGNAGDTTTLKFIPARNGFEVSDENGDSIAYIVKNALMTINGGGGGGGDKFNLSLTEATGAKGTEVCIDLSVENFTDIETMQFSLNWNPNVATYKSTKDFNLKNFSLGGVFTNNPGQLRISWEEGTGGTHTVVGKTRIATVCFDLTGAAGSSTSVDFTDTPIEIEITDGNSDIVDYTTQSGKLTIQGGGGGGADNFTFVASTEKADKNKDICVGVSVKKFTNIASMQFSMLWDDNILLNARVENTNLLGLSPVNSFNIVGGTLRCSWIETTGNGKTLPDDTVIFDLCFTTSSQCGSRSSVIFTGNPSTIEVLDNDDNDVTPVDLVQGEVAIDCGGGNAKDFELSAGSGAIKKGDEICVDISVKEFKEIEAMQFSIAWDPNVLSFTRVSNIDIPDFSGANYSESPTGRLRVTWSPLNGNPLTFRDGRMFQICFNGSGACDATSAVRITDSPLSIDVEDVYGTIDPVVTNNGSINITCDNTPLVVTLVNQRNVRCNGDCNGSISISVAGATSYSYQWFKNGSVFKTTKNLANICAGEYYVIVTDANDASRTVTLPVVVLDSPPPLVLTVIVNEPDTGNCSGKIVVEASGGWGNYSYTWLSVNPQVRDSVLENACKGDQVVNVIDGGNCNIRDTFIVSGVQISDNATITGLSCNGDCNASITLNPKGGTSPFTFKWTGPGTVENEQNQDKLCAGSYQVVITDSQGEQITKSYTITDPAGIIIVIDGITPSTGSNGQVNVTIAGGAGPFSYIWKNENGDVVSVQEDLKGVAPGDYTLEVTDNNGCSNTTTQTVPSDGFDVTYTVSTVVGNNNVSCNASNDGWIKLELDNSGDYDYEWSHDSSLNGPLAENLTAGTYSVNIKDKNTGDVLKTISNIVLTEPAVLEITNMERIKCADAEGNENGVYEVTVSGGTPTYEYQWCNNETTRRAFSLEGGTACDILVTDANGCQVFLDEISICSDSISEPPTDCYEGRKVISPNGDGKNDHLWITCDNDYPNKLTIYDRWGRLVYEVNNYNSSLTGTGWQGVDKSGADLNEGGYMWVLRVDLPNGDQRIYRGTVILVR